MRPMIVAAAIALSGCAQLITPENSVSVSVANEAGTEQTYRNIMLMMRECFPAHVAVEAQYYPEAKVGDVMVAAVSDGNRLEFFKIAVASNGTGSVANMTTRSSFNDLFSKALPSWVRGADGGCPGGTRPITAAPSRGPQSLVY